LPAEADVKLSVAELDAMPESRAGELLGECCGGSRWVTQMLARRPFRSLDRVLSAADDVWRSLDPADWREAFSHHPRIGERKSAVPQNERGSSWAAGEQSGVERADDEVRRALAEANREYERRFGYIYIVFATRKSAQEMLALATQRLENDPDVELRAAAEEQRRITRLRLNKLLGG
jgi:2-oxo-4-hydroxy-4-carboxy-5-ureidoimidazoline decarboxylase